mmetsp:Transcript_5519/g.16954  ORF Transcript_5519/g.16954 Transcript_5519/m.16954 type:complete len:147 (+) Transcript_5519:94-534(+)
MMCATSFYQDVKEFLTSAQKVRREIVGVCRAHDRRCEDGTLEKDLELDANFAAFDCSLRHSPLFEEYARYVEGAQLTGTILLAPFASASGTAARSNCTPSTAAPQRIDWPKRAPRRFAHTPPPSPQCKPLSVQQQPSGEELMFKLD